MNFMEVVKSPIAQFSAGVIGGVSILSASAIANPGYGPLMGVFPIIFGASFFVCLLAYMNAGIDAALIYREQSINHPKRFILRAALAAGFSLIAFGFTYNALWLTIYQGALFWIVFDIFLAKARGLKWNYISTWVGTSILDLIFKGNWIPWMLTKFAILIGSLILLY